jgi:hypothetical protein
MNPEHGRVQSDQREHRAVRRRNQYTFNGTTAAGSTPDNANLISSIISPRVIRFGLQVNW